MHATTTSLLFLLLALLVRPSRQAPSAPRLVRGTGCRCSTTAAAASSPSSSSSSSVGQQNHHVFWLQPPPMENPGDTCARLAAELGHWLDWIDGRTNLQVAWQMYDDVVQNRRRRGGDGGPGADEAAAAPGKAPPPRRAGDGSDDVKCDIEGMSETDDGGDDDVTAWQMVAVKVGLGLILVVVVFESVTAIWR
ncbi:uncharacterized protein BKCO1_2500028 [Diplodia corticola]|uniref:Uncharacterized protein n=1 Tax=Diplodia corticola TaxID=236234 RepID=A0A1J9QYK4_9PEZI|nr:uncharacterized protein BKCO1_2500028 [Diplodia corticola]OJD34134.1 hypothetical protein BKCO1_2500028 [Diplodia corticola]